MTTLTFIQYPFLNNDFAIGLSMPIALTMPIALFGCDGLFNSLMSQATVFSNIPVMNFLILLCLKPQGNVPLLSQTADYFQQRGIFKPAIPVSSSVEWFVLIHVQEVKQRFLQKQCCYVVFCHQRMTYVELSLRFSVNIISNRTLKLHLIYIKHTECDLNVNTHLVQLRHTSHVR